MLLDSFLAKLFHNACKLDHSACFMGTSHSKNDVGKTASSMYSERGSLPAKILPRDKNTVTSIKRPKNEKCLNVSIRQNSSIKMPPNTKKSSPETRNNENSLVIPSSSSYPYPRGHSTVLVPSSSWNCRPAISSPIIEDKPFLTDRRTFNSGFDHRPTKIVYFNSSVDGMRKVAGTFVKKFPKPAANVCVPSPIYSCSEPSSLSVSRSETREFANNAGVDFSGATSSRQRSYLIPKRSYSVSGVARHFSVICTRANT
uniref:Uncharacterized protein n=1 Tax=Romanomermis culicivorax TaxID=13658 RepID=A0A915HZM5_ROMCU